MGDFVHCNKCLFRPKQQPTTKIFITSCYHIVCEKCIDGGAPGTPCKICSKPMKALEINRDLDPHLQELFMNPKQMLAKRLAALKKKDDFQKMMYNSFMNHYKSQKAKLGQAMQYCQKQVNASKEKDREIAELKEWLATAKEKVAAMEKERNDAQRQLAELRQLESRVNAPTSMDSSIGRMFGFPVEGEAPQYDVAFDSQTMGFHSQMDLNESVCSNRSPLNGSARMSMNSPRQSNSSLLSEITTPKMLGIRNMAPAVSMFGQRLPPAPNPYADFFARNSPRNHHQPPMNPSPANRSGGRRGDNVQFKSLPFSSGTISRGSIIPKNNTPSASHFREPQLPF